MELNAPNSVDRFGLRHWIVILVAAFGYALFIIPTWSEAYIDFGDGNYLYIATRIAEGAVVYRDILAPQPPVHLFVGAGLVRLAEWIGLATPLYLIRAFSLLLHLGGFLLVADLARKAWGSATAGVFAGAVYLLLPINLWWSMGYESENLEIVFLLLMMRFALKATRGGDLLAGIFGALAALTNLTAAPFLLVLIVFMIIQNFRRALRIAIPALVVTGAVIVIMEIHSGGYFLRNAVFNQVGTYPRENLGEYILGKLTREGGDIIWLEWPFLVLAAIGFLLYPRMSPLPDEARKGLGWFCAATLLSFLYVTKGGTVDYIFCLGGPAVAMLAAGVVKPLKQFCGEEATAVPATNLGANGRRTCVAANRTHETYGTDGTIVSDEAGGEGSAESSVDAASGAEPTTESAPRVAAEPLRVAAILIAALLIFGLATIGPLRPMINHYLRLWNQAAFELPDLPPDEMTKEGEPRPNVQQVKLWIERYSKPGDTILAPPFYAFLTNRKIWGDYSEIFIWTIKDFNDRQDNNPSGEGWSKSRAMAEAIGRRELPIVIIELDQTGKLPEVKAALEENYEMILKEPYRTLNTRLGVYVPKN